LFEKYTELKIEEMFIVYFDEKKDNYEKIEIQDLQKEVKEILEIRKREII
jgi:glutaredoxin-related protein